MFEGFDPILLARIQFAFTVSFHFVFPAFSIGLASYLAVLEGLWLKTGKQLWRFYIVPGQPGVDQDETTKLAGLGWERLPAGHRGSVPHCHSAEEEILIVLDGE